MTLRQFYRSDKWYEFTRALRLERTTDDVLLCEYCGKPIVEAYDAICHHKEPITEETCNNAEISLNPENIHVVHHACHNRIHDRFNVWRDREVYLVYGSPFSGKSTWVESVKNKGDLVVDIDLIWQCVTGGEKYEKPGTLNAVVFNVRDELFRAVKMRAGKWQCAYVVGGFPLISERERLLRELGAKEIRVGTDRATCEKRCMSCQDGRDKDLWMQFIADWWEKSGPPGP